MGGGEWRGGLEAKWRGGEGEVKWRVGSEEWGVGSGE
jgi:hypothetical protein